MDQPNAPIIKSGSQHAVQIGEGSKHAKSVRNVVATDEAKPLADRFVQADDSSALADAERTVALPDAPLVTDRWAHGDPQVDVQDPALAVPTQAPQPGTRIVLESTSSDSPSATGPTVAQRERGDEDARAAKDDVLAQTRVRLPGQGHVQDRWLQVAQERERARALLVQAGAEVLTPVASLVASDAQSAKVADANAERQTPAAVAPPSALLARLKAIRSHMAVTETQLERIDDSEPPPKT